MVSLPGWSRAGSSGDPKIHRPPRTTVLGIVGAFVATWIGQAIGWYQPDQGAGLIGAIVGAVVVLFIWHRLVAARVIGDPGAGR